MEDRSTSTIRVLLVGLDGGGARATLSAAVDLDVEAVSSFAEAALSLRRGRPRAMVVALGAPQARDLELLRQLIESAEDVPLLLVSPPASEELVVGSIKAGIAGYLFGNDAQPLTSAVRELLRGGLPMSAPVSELVMRRARRSSAKMIAVQPPGDAKPPLLTERQHEILRFLQLGHSYEDIGTSLGLSVNTVRSHVRSVYERLGASTKVEAVMIAMELGLLQRTRFTSNPPPKP